jgi:hypothetical protein
MIELLLFVAVGLGLLVLLFLVMRRPPGAAEGAAGALVAAKHSLQVLQKGLLPAHLVERIFGTQDLEYVTSLKSKDLQHLFLRERKWMALAWVRQVRTQILSLKEFHTSRSRMFAGMSRTTELSVALDFARIQIECRLLQLLVRWRGPYAAPRLVRQTATAATGLCAVLDESLGFLTPRTAGGPQNDSGTGASAL